MSDLPSSKDVSAFAVSCMQIQPDGTATSSGWLVPLMYWDSFVQILNKYGMPIGDTLLPADAIPEMVRHVGEGLIEL
jgi:hypothetical protein